MSDPVAKICAVRAADGGARLFVTVEYTEADSKKREVLEVFASRLSCVPALGEIGEESLCCLRREARLCRALALGMHALAASGGSQKGLEQKLRARGISEDVAREAVAELTARGYIDEERGALREAERAAAKLWGNRRIIAELRAKGYSEEAVRAAMEVLSREDSTARCRKLLQKRYARQMQDAAQVSKVIAALMRYGYTQSEIRAALQYNQTRG